MHVFLGNQSQGDMVQGLGEASVKRAERPEVGVQWPGSVLGERIQR